ncbi:MAG: endonuclease NucS [Gordonia sp. (in: high G+C Gram-positive bacteria)]|uniref:hypothetical protein n=1 Tax=Gordonia sp. (in: high G+C Gram-positive bacteria) TaxID=84139 RepID=UPI0039E6FB1B
MGLEMGLWRADGSKLTRLSPSGVGLESQLEDYIESDPTLLGNDLLIFGRQVPTAHGGFIDLLAVDSDGTVHVLELKRDKTPRDVVAQVLDYGSWVAELSRADVIGIYEQYRARYANESPQAFDEAFGSKFGGDAPPDELNASQTLTIIAASVDAATERIVRFLNEGYAVPVNVVFFRHYEDGGNSYLARTWLVESEPSAAASAVSKARKSREQWNGQDWYVSFGEEPGGRSWDDAVKYGFVSAGGTDWFSRTLKNLPLDARVLVHIPKAGFVGVGTVLGPAKPFVEAEVDIEGAPVRLADQTLAGSYRHPGDEESTENAEYVVPVKWLATRPRDEAVWKQGMFANQNSACKLRSQFTIEQVTAALGVDD